VLSALALVVGFLLVPAQPATAAPACPIAIAHRGNTAGGPIENSIGAFNATFATGAKWFEADVLWTSDNVPVLMHDQTVDRTTTGTGAVASMTAAQFTALTLNDGQHPPTLDQALALIRASSDRQMVLEVKNILTAAQQTILLDELRGLEAQVHPNGFADHLPSLQALKAADPLLSISLATYDPVLPLRPGSPARTWSTPTSLRRGSRSCTQPGSPCGPGCRTARAPGRTCAPTVSTPS